MNANPRLHLRPQLQPRPLTPTARPLAPRNCVLAGTLLILAWTPVQPAQAGFAAAGQGIQTILQGSLPGAALFLETHPAWTNVAIPPKPYVVETSFNVPACDAVAVGRLILTVWGGTANYTARLGIEFNGVAVPGAAPLAFGSTNDAHPVFNASLPSVYGSGSGVWLLGIPIPGDLFRRDGSPNQVRLTLETSDSFDGRVNHVTLLAIRQSAGLTHSLDYVVAEGSGDIYRAPTGSQVDARSVPLGTTEPAGAATARLQALYTYGDIAQNDRLYFNGSALGGDDVANYDKAATGLDFGPVLVDFDVLGRLAATNQVTVSVAATDVPDTRETSLRPQLIVLQVTRASATAPPLDIGLGVVISWPTTAAGYQLEFRPAAEAGAWTPVTNVPVAIDGRNTVILPPTAPRQFYQLRPTP